MSQQTIKELSQTLISDNRDYLKFLTATLKKLKPSNPKSLAVIFTKDVNSYEDLKKRWIAFYLKEIKLTKQELDFNQEMYNKLSKNTVEFEKLRPVPTDEQIMELYKQILNDIRLQTLKKRNKVK